MKKLKTIMIFMVTTLSIQSGLAYGPARFNRPRIRHVVKRVVLSFNQHKVHKGKTILLLKKKLFRQHGINPRRFKLQRVKLVAKSKMGKGRASLIVGRWKSRPKIVQGNPYTFRRNSNYSYDRVNFKNNQFRGLGRWQILLKGKFKVKKVVLFLTK
jgi:hypothetical protein